MAKTNNKPEPKFTHEGAKAYHLTPEQELRRSVMACMLFENQFYEDGKTITDRIQNLCLKVSDEKIQEIAVKARNEQYLRHIPLFLVREMTRKGSKRVSDTLYEVIQRADELAEFMALYWKEGKTPIASQVKKGLARAFTKFNEYNLTKYNRDNAIKLRDVLFLCHAKPKDNEQAEIWKRLVNNELTIPDTWETNLSAGKDKKEVFTRLLQEKKLGGLAFLRNLRNMNESKVDPTLIKDYMKEMKAEKVLPFRFISAAKYVPNFEPELEQLMLKCLQGKEKLSGKTIFLIDGSGSMFGTTVSKKSEIDRFEAACALAILLREICEQCEIYVFSNNTFLIPARHGFALRDAIRQKAQSGGTYTNGAIEIANKSGYDRLIIITDEQSHTSYPDPINKDKNYVINVASYQNGLGYGIWNHIDGWSETVVDYITEYEKFSDNIKNS